MNYRALWKPAVVGLACIVAGCAPKMSGPTIEVFVGDVFMYPRNSLVYSNSVFVSKTYEFKDDKTIISESRAFHSETFVCADKSIREELGDIICSADISYDSGADLQVSFQEGPKKFRKGKWDVVYYDCNSDAVPDAAELLGKPVAKTGEMLPEGIVLNKDSPAYSTLRNKLAARLNISP